MQLTFSLRNSRNNSVQLVAIDEDGNPWIILKFIRDGRIIRERHIPTHLGLQVDDEGRVIIE